MIILGHEHQKYSFSSGKNECLVEAWRLYKSSNCNPLARPAHVDKSWSQAWLQVLQTSLRGSFKIWNFVGARSSLAVWGMRVEKPLAWATFFQYFQQFKETQCLAFSGTFAPRLNQSSSQCPGARPAHVANSWPWAQLQVLQNSGSQMFMFRFKSWN